jgi:hypothetical protein
MFGMFCRRKDKTDTATTEELIKAEHKKLSKRVDRDIVNIEKINAVLRNGITLNIYHATGGKHK